MGISLRHHAQLYRHSKTYWLSVITMIAIFVVNTLGFTDTVTGSAMGCGRNWPLCNGQLIPSPWNTATLIEYTHRVSVLVGGVLLLALSVAVWRKYGRIRSVRFLVLLSLIGVFLEGGLGALAVLFVNPPVVMAGHMGIALISFGSVFLLTSVFRQTERAANSGIARQPLNGELRPFARWVWWSIPYGYAAIYVGAYVASTGYGGSFQGWPIPSESYAQVGTVFLVDILHRSVALGYLLLMARLVWLAYRVRRVRPQLFKMSCAALVLVCLQALSGGVLIVTHLNVYASLFHVTNVSFLFATQCYLGLQVFLERHVGIDNRVGGTERTRGRGNGQDGRDLR